MPAVIGPEHDDGVVGMAARFEGVQHPPDLAIDEGHRAEVRRDEVAPLVALFQELQARLGKLPMQVPAEPRRVVAVVSTHRRQDDFVRRVHVVPLLGYVARHVRQEEPHGQKERLLPRTAERPLELLDRPARDRPVPFVLVLVRERAPVDQGVILRCVHEFLLGSRPDAGRRAQRLEFAGAFSPSVAPVIDFAGAVGGVSVALEVLRQRLEILEGIDFPEPRSQSVDPRVRRTATEHQARAGRIAEGSLSMGVVERGAPRGQPVHVRRHHLGMTVQRADPVIEVVDRDEEDVRWGGRRALRAGEGQRRGGDR